MMMQVSQLMFLLMCGMILTMVRRRRHLGTGIVALPLQPTIAQLLAHLIAAFKDSLTSGPDFDNLVKYLADELKASQAAAAKTIKAVEWQKMLVLESEKSKRNTSNNVASLREWIAHASLCEAGLVSNASAASRQMTKATVALRQTSNAI